jgi:hypothetical protein
LPSLAPSIPRLPVKATADVPAADWVKTGS